MAAFFPRIITKFFDELRFGTRFSYGVARRDPDRRSHLPIYFFASDQVYLWYAGYVGFLYIASAWMDVADGFPI